MEISRQLEDIRHAAMAWRSSSSGTTDDTAPEPATQSSQWLSTGQAGELLGISSRAVRKAIAESRLPAATVGDRYRVSREDIEHYRAARVA